MSDWAEKSEYNGDCDITRMVWNMGDDNGYSTWGKMRAVMALEQSRDNPFDGQTIEACAENLLEGTFPIFDVGAQLNIYVRKWGDWDDFIRSWAEAEAGLRDVDYAEDEEEMAQMLEDCSFEAVPGWTVEEFNKRLWEYEVEGMSEALWDDFTDLKERLTVARTMLLAATGEAA